MTSHVGGSRGNPGPVGHEQFTWELRDRETQVASGSRGSCKSRTQLQIVYQDIADPEADRAVVEHPHFREEEEHAEWDHLVKGYFDEDDGTTLDLVQVKAGVEREVAFMGGRAIARRLDKCGQRDVVADGNVTLCAVSLLRDSSEKEQITLSSVNSLFPATADFSVAFMHSSMTEEVFVQPPTEANLPQGTVWLLRRALNGLRCAAAAFQAYLRSLLEDAGFRRSMAALSIYHREEDGRGGVSTRRWSCGHRSRKANTSIV